MADDPDLEARAHELSAIYENAPGIIFYIAVELDGEFRFVSMSQPGLVATGMKREEIEGRLVRDVIPSPSCDLALKYYRVAIQSGRTVRWREVSEFPAGRRVGDVAVTPVYDQHGVATHLVGIVHDITDRESLEESLHQREERLAFLLTLDDLLQPLSDPVERQQAAARLLADYLRVSRVCYADIGEGYMVRHTYAAGKAPSIERGPISPLGTALLGAYERARVIAVNDVQTDPQVLDDERSTLLAGDIAAFAGVLIEKSQRRKGAFGVHSATPRTWRPAEVALIRDVAERTWEAVERSRAETELREREHRLRLALDASGGGSWTWDARTNEVDWDPVFRQLYGFSNDVPATFDAWFSRVHEDDSAQVVRLLHDLLNSTTKDAWDNTFRIMRLDGSISWIQSLGHADRAADGHVTRLTGLELDITERRRSEDALRARQDDERDRELRLLLETAPQGIVSVDGLGTITMANRAMETMFGYDNGALIGHSIEPLVPLPLCEDHGVELDLVGQRKDGSKFPIEVTVNHVATPTGRRAIAFVTDISARKLAESALHERTLELQRRTSQLSRMASDLTLAERRAREELATTLHDGLQQLLVVSAMSVDSQVQRMARLGLPTEELVEAKQLLDDAIDAARSLSVELYPPLLKSAGLPTALNWLANWMHQKYGLKAHVSGDSRADSTRSDVRTLLFESVRELLFNVVKHAGVDQVDVTLARDANDMLCITVADAGVGFDVAGLAERTKTSHVGWGLFSIRERLTLLGGHFEIDSTPGKGTRFCLTAPRGVPPVAPTRPSKSVARVEAMRPLRILLVDDHAPIRNALRELLQARPELSVVGEASDGLEALVQAHALHPEVILMDISMPRMDGVEATRRLGAELPFVQVLGLSIHSRTGDLHPIEQAGAVDFFTKGADTRRLIDRLLAIHAEIEPHSEVTST